MQTKRMSVIKRVNRVDTPTEVTGIEVGPFKIFLWPEDKGMSWARWNVQHTSGKGFAWGFKRRKDAVGFCNRLLESHRKEYEEPGFLPIKGTPVGVAMYEAACSAAREFQGVR